MPDLLQRHNVTVVGPASGPTLLLAHGFGCDQSMWRHVLPELVADHHVVLFDHDGAAGTRAEDFDFERHEQLDGYAADVVDLVRAMDLHDVVLVGHSVSAVIGALATIEAPERFRGLAMVSPSPRYVDDDGYVGGFSRADIEGLLETMDRNYLGWASGMADLVAGGDRTGASQELENSFCRTDPQIARHFARTTFLGDNRDDLVHVPVPCLVIQSTHDTIAPPAVGRFVTEQLPDAALRTVDTVGHCPHLTEPVATATELRRFVASLPLRT